MKLLTRKHILLLFTILLIQQSTFVFSWLDPEKEMMDKANKNYKNKKYQESIKIYKNLEGKIGDKGKKAKTHYNKGNTFYQLEQYKNALQEYYKAYQGGNKETREKALNNMGNSYLKMGSKKKALESYLQSLRENPNQNLVRKNIEKLFKKTPPKKNKQDKQKNDNKKKKSRINKKAKNNKRKSKNKIRNKTKRKKVKRTKLKKSLNLKIKKWRKRLLKRQVEIKLTEK